MDIVSSKEIKKSKWTRNWIKTQTSIEKKRRNEKSIKSSVNELIVYDKS